MVQGERKELCKFFFVATTLLLVYLVVCLYTRDPNHAGTWNLLRLFGVAGWGGKREREPGNILVHSLVFWASRSECTCVYVFCTCASVCVAMRMSVCICLYVREVTKWDCRAQMFKKKTFKTK